MEIMHSEAQAALLRSKCDHVRKRIWIASPFIGSWSEVRRIIGVNWLKREVEVRLLTDEDNKRFLHKKTLEQFSYAGKLRTLDGLHAKIYIIDSFALITSANLTGTGFSRRREAGVHLAGKEIKPVVSLFEKWWGSAESRPLDIEAIQEAKPETSPGKDQPGRAHLGLLWKLPPDPGDIVVSRDPTFFRYDHFLSCYRDLAEKYSAVHRLRKDWPLYFEVDAFLNYLYHDHPRTPSQTFGKEKPASLTGSQQESRIERYAKQFAVWLSSRDPKEEAWRTRNAKTVHRILSRNLRRTITREEIKEVLFQLNCMTSVPIARAKFLNNNSRKAISTAWRRLIDDRLPVQRRMVDCYNSLEFCGRSIIQEIIGFYDPEHYPIRNQNSNCGLRFFGYKVSRY